MSKPPSTAPRRGASRVSFLKHADLIRKLLNEGHNQRWIYDDHLGGKEQLGMSYSQFNRYVGREILKKENGNGHQNQGGVATGNSPSDRSASQPDQSRGATSASPPQQQQPSTRPPFVHDAKGGAERDDLF